MSHISRIKHRGMGPNGPHYPWLAGGFMPTTYPGTSMQHLFEKVTSNHLVRPTPIITVSRIVLFLQQREGWPAASRPPLSYYQSLVDRPWPSTMSSRSQRSRGGSHCTNAVSGQCHLHRMRTHDALIKRHIGAPTSSPAPRCAADVCGVVYGQ